MLKAEYDLVKTVMSLVEGLAENRLTDGKTDLWLQAEGGQEEGWSASLGLADGNHYIQNG